MSAATAARCAAALLGILVAMALAAPAGAVDRRLGADVPKPAASGEPWSDDRVAALRAATDAALDGAEVVRGAHVGVQIVDPRTGAILYARNADHAFTPASTLKLVVGSAALDALSPDWRPRTIVYARYALPQYTPLVAKGTLQGDLVIRGGGDALLRFSDLAGLVAALKARGVQAVRGSVLVNNDHFEDEGRPPGWSWDDFGYAYAPRVAATSLEENALHLRIIPSAPIGSQLTVAPLAHVVTACIEGCIPSVQPRVRGRFRVGPPGTRDDLSIELSAENVLEVTGTIPSDVTEETLDAAVPSAAAYVRDAVRQLLTDRGIKPGFMATPQRASITTSDPKYLGRQDDGSPATAEETLWTHDGEPMRDYLADLWQPSDNLIAEMLLRELGVKAAGEPGTADNGLGFERTWLHALGADETKADLRDGSGLSVYDRITPAILNAVLVHDWNGPYRDVVLDALPIAGVRGTLAAAHRGTSLERRLFAKTGTLTHASALSGYLATKRHGALVMTFLVDDWIGAPAALRELRTKILSAYVED